MAGSKDVPVAVVGAGGFGTCLAVLLARKGCEVRLWARNPDTAQKLANSRENVHYLPGVKLPLNIWCTSNLQDAVSDAKAVIAAVPSKGMREMGRALAPVVDPKAPVLNIAKGIEDGTYLRMSQVLEAELGDKHKVASLSGPNFAEEIARGLPGATVIAGKHRPTLDELCALVTTDSFKAYPKTDLVGVELGGVMKNVTAIAAGLTHGIGFGANASAAVITLGLDEMVRFGVAHGAKRDTFTGLSGLGDLILTATSTRSRNHRVGELLGRGLTKEQALATMGGQVAEGVAAAKFVHEQAVKENVDLPLTAEIYRILYEGKNVRTAVADLLSLL